MRLIVRTFDASNAVVNEWSFGGNCAARGHYAEVTKNPRHPNVTRVVLLRVVDGREVTVLTGHVAR